jgi:hypothetical protein
MNDTPPMMPDCKLDVTSVSVIASNDLFGVSDCGSSWHGFWKLPDRYEAWMGVATSASNTANGYAMANKAMGKPVEDENVQHLNRLFSWAYRRAKQYRPDWVKIYRP